MFGGMRQIWFDSSLVPAQFWAQELQATVGDNFNIVSSIVDSVGSIYIGGYNSNGSGYGEIIKLNSSGIILWNYSYPYEGPFYGIVFDDTQSNIYAVGGFGTIVGKAMITKISCLDGSIVWSNFYALTDQAANQAWALDGAVRLSTGDIVASGQYLKSTPSSKNRLGIGQFYSNGVVRAVTHISSASVDINSQNLYNNIVVDTSNNVYVTAYVINSNHVQTFISKLPSGVGSITWQQVLDSGLTANLQAAGMTIDSSNNIYSMLYDTDPNRLSGYGNVYIAKYNSSGTKQWINRVEPLSINGMFPTGAFYTDPYDNIYFSSLDFNGNNLVSQMSTSGTINWTQSYESSSDYFVINDITTKANVLFIGGDGNSGSYNFYLPNNRSLTQTFTFANDTITVSNITTLTTTTTSITDTSGSYALAGSTVSTSATGIVPNALTVTNLIQRFQG